MSLDSINNYAAPRSTDTSNTSSSSSSNMSSSTLTMQDFFSLMVAELSNQDMYNTVDNTQYISQLAQFSMMQAFSDLRETFSSSFSDLTMAYSISYGVGLIGKEVTLAKVDDNGNVSTYKGIVEGVNLFNGKTEIVVDGKTFALNSVMKVKEPDIIIPDSDVKENNDSVDETGETNDSVDETEETNGSVDNTEEDGAAGSGGDGSEDSGSTGGSEGGGDGE